MRKSLVYFNLFIFISSYLISQDLGSMNNKANNKLKSSELKESELILEKILEIDPSYAPARVTFSKLWLQRADLSKANEYATLAVRIDEDFRPWWDELNEIRKKIQIGTSNVKKQNYAVAEEIFLDLIP